MSTNEMITALVDQLCGHEAECPRLKSRQETPEFGGDDTAPRPDCTCFARLIMALEAE